MPKYTKQRDRYNCGPVAILNALRWAGENASYASRIAYLERLCKSQAPDIGCNHTNFDRALRKAGSGIFLVRRVYQPQVREMEAHLKAGGAVVFNYGWENRKKFGRHFTLLIPGIAEAIFGMINAHTRGPALRNHGQSKFREMGLQFRIDEHRKGWFLTKLP